MVAGLALVVVGAIFAVELLALGACVMLVGPILLLLWRPPWVVQPPLDFYDWFSDREHRPGWKRRNRH